MHFAQRHVSKLIVVPSLRDFFNRTEKYTRIELLQIYLKSIIGM